MGSRPGLVLSTVCKGVTMEHATITIPDSVFQRAKTKAQKEDRTVDEPVSDLLDRWVTGEIRLPVSEGSRDELVNLARAAYGMWADRDPDAYLAAGRSGLAERDEKRNNKKNQETSHVVG